MVFVVDEWRRRQAYEKGLEGKEVRDGFFSSPSPEEKEANRRGLDDKYRLDEEDRRRQLRDKEQDEEVGYSNNPLETGAWTENEWYRAPEHKSGSCSEFDRSRTAYKEDLSLVEKGSYRKYNPYEILVATFSFQEYQEFENSLASSPGAKGILGGWELAKCIRDLIADGGLAAGDLHEFSYFLHAWLVQGERATCNQNPRWKRLLVIIRDKKGLGGRS